MQRFDNSVRYSATDLVGHLNCRYLTSLNLAVERGEVTKPHVHDPHAELLWERGRRHEQAFVQSLADKGAHITTIAGVGIDTSAVEQTAAAMKAGNEIIVQAAFRSSKAVGRADVLKRVETPSELGAWSYEVIDTKLARETKGGTVLQLCLYSDLLADAQGVHPHSAHVVIPFTDFGEQSYRLNDYQAYFRQVRKSLEDNLLGNGGEAPYPHPVEHCEICVWQKPCRDRRRADDHLSLVAGISKIQIDELKLQGIETLAGLAAMPLPLTWKPTRGAAPSYGRIREQARIQREGRVASEILHELLPIEPEFGLAALPTPSKGDIFLDLESDPFVGQGGLEFLFGYAFLDDKGELTYTAQWALNRQQERSAYEQFIDFTIARAAIYPDLHIYHYAPYEPAALKRLMGRYGSREDEVDTLLRQRRFVDLYAVVKSGLRASVESYSIKRLEPLYGFERATPLQEANVALSRINALLELDESADILDADREATEGYNRDDCLSAWKLRDWLESRRRDLVATGVEISRPSKQLTETTEELGARQERVAALISRLTNNLPTAVEDRDNVQQATWLLAYTIDWHRREDKAAWWEYFRLSDLAADDLMDERAGLAGLSFSGVNGGTAKAPIHRYTFPPQETELRGGEDLRALGGAKFGSVEMISLEEGLVDIKKRGDSVDSHPEAIFAHKIIPGKEQAEALCRLGDWVAENNIDGEGPHRAARDLLLRKPPPVSGHPIKREDETGFDSALRLAALIGDGLLPIQGPPGAGKTHTAAAMICVLAQAGKTVGITANSHSVIRNLLDAVVREAEKRQLEITCVQKPKEAEPDLPRLKFAKSNAALYAAIGSTAQVGGGTAWAWSPAAAFASVDVLFIDEAAQMALANVLAVAQSARTIILLGDPQQLEQPIKGSHPDGTDVSALHHLLANQQTISDDKGLFLAETWRLHPSICSFISELFYDGRLHPRPGLELQEIVSNGPICGSGLRFVAVPTEGNQNASPEEADRIQAIVEGLLSSQSSWIDRDGVAHTLRLEDILIITPYNAQVYELKTRIAGARIGTVDKFQGQEAPIVIYSMTTSSYADAPRGMEFLYSLNRLNVAVSRAKCLCVMVASPSIFNALCRTPRQMQLANAFCRYLELATVLQV